MSVNQPLEVISDTVRIVKAVRYTMCITVNRRSWRIAIILLMTGVDIS